MVGASAGLNAGTSDVSAPTMWREQYSPARKGETVRVAPVDNQTCPVQVFLRLNTMRLADLIPQKMRDSFDKSAQPKPVQKPKPKPAKKC